MVKDSESRGILHQERETLLTQLQEWLETPMQVLALVWLLLLIIELTTGLSPFLYYLGLTIWAVFIFEFLLDYTLAPHKLAFLKRNLLTVVSLLVPALRILRFLRALRLLSAARGLRLVRILGSLNRGITTLRGGMKRRGFGYFFALTLLVTLVGAAGMYAFEQAPEGESGIQNYGDALWWTAMLLTSIGSDYWPQSPEGRILALFLAIYGLAVFGYITAAFASLFIGRDVKREQATNIEASIEALHEELSALRDERRGKDELR